MPNPAPPFVARYDVRPCRFVMCLQNFSAQEANGQNPIVGISGEGVTTTPLSDWQQTPLAAKQDQRLHVQTIGDICLLELASTVDCGMFVQSDAQGRGQELSGIAGTTNFIGAISLQSGNAGHKILVQVCIGMRTNP